MKASVYIATSLDGFIAREDGDLDWLPGSDPNESHDSGEVNEDYGYQEFMDSVDVLVMGRSTFETVLAFGQWPYGGKRVVVLSSKLRPGSDDLPESVEVMSGSPGEVIEALQESGARHLYIDGGKTIQGFLNAGLIQELIITVVPVLIGTGIPLFGALDHDLKLQHVETRSFPNGFVQSKYRLFA